MVHLVLVQIDGCLWLQGRAGGPAARVIES